jgi:pimeloyl-ACP methyl ester carboxylesterase
MRPKVRSFVDEFAANEMSFKRASYTWRGFRNLLPNPKRIGETIREKNIPFLIIMGSFDQVIRPKQAYAFEKRCGLKGHVVEVENGHNFFKSSSINKFVHLLPFMD